MDVAPPRTCKYDIKAPETRDSKLMALSQVTIRRADISRRSTENMSRLGTRKLIFVNEFTEIMCTAGIP